MKHLILSTAFAVIGAASASATTITIEEFDAADYAFYTAVGATIQDFENLDTSLIDFETGTPRSADGTEVYGEIAGSLSTNVGTFTTVGGTGIGNTCANLSLNGRSCDNIALQFDPNLNGQGNVVPDDGQWSLNANDTLGIVWQASLLGGETFNALLFTLQDAADQSATLTVTAEGGTASLDMASLSGLSNNNTQLFIVQFGTAVSNATITMANSRTNDSFTFDGAAVYATRGGLNNNLPPIPLPAGVWLLLSGVGAMVVAGRRRRSA